MGDSSSSKVKFIPDNPETHLPRIDPMTHEGIWATLDTGCNSTCHGKVWRQNAEKKLARLNMRMYKISDKSHDFNGIGTAQTTGKWYMPVGVKLADWNVDIPMTLKSDEIGDRTPLLVSCGDISHMGLDISLRHGTVQLLIMTGKSLRWLRTHFQAYP